MSPLKRFLMQASIFNTYMLIPHAIWINSLSNFGWSGVQEVLIACVFMGLPIVYMLNIKCDVCSEHRIDVRALRRWGWLTYIPLNPPCVHCGAE